MNATPDWRPFAPPDAEPAGVLAAGKDYAAEAAMKVQDWRFRRFLAERHGLVPPLTAERATQRLRGLLGVTSRRELNDGGRAALAWVRLRNDFETWRRETFG